MPHKNENTTRWGGPGASHEDRTKPPPNDKHGAAPGQPTNQPYSHVSGGGGERDRHHGHAADSKRDTEENSEQKRRP